MLCSAPLIGCLVSYMRSVATIKLKKLVFHTDVRRHRSLGSQTIRAPSVGEMSSEAGLRVVSLISSAEGPSSSSSSSQTPPAGPSAARRHQEAVAIIIAPSAPSRPSAAALATHEVPLIRQRYIVCASGPTNPRATMASAILSLLSQAVWIQV